ncbi:MULTISPECIES: GNAT family protein [unclassified Ensifer]|uniref:GNAT family N-acetyltransferase n=1 Tax=unclassified Ensifer TaxID=2633371 RepID=UPI00081398C1|nr:MULTISPECIES: GNAT family protein [unclassified Ensifer]OCO99637.1 acetyltransferase [Ensifer sp. LC14]OCP02578.1 acetyltransferase [Ensifer sp. LC11]OCP02847.1 acetyltransferase [Ensifer sp. LC13]OCP29867.1 acetyltransferase [Ensifer sp. LC499]
MTLSELRIFTDRLVIRSFAPDDFPAFFAYHRLPEVYRYLYQEPLDEKAARAKFAKASMPRLDEDGDVAVFAVERQEDGVLIGEVLLKLASKDAKQAETGYIFNPAFAGKGYATEAMRVVLDLGFSTLNFHRIFARLDALNSGSVGVVERLGMRREAHLIENDRFNDTWGDEFVYALLRREWQARSQVG